MHSTSKSLLERLRKPDDGRSWGRFVQLYTPLLLVWARKLGLADADAADLVQDVFVVLFEKLPGFRYDPSMRFRGWLWTLARNKHLERKRRKAPVPVDLAAEVADPSPPHPLDEAEYREYVARRALELMQREFRPTTWRACWETVVNGRDPAEVAKELAISTSAVYVARCRVLGRLRHELSGLFE